MGADRGGPIRGRCGSEHDDREEHAGVAAQVHRRRARVRRVAKGPRLEAEGGKASAYEADITDEAACQALAAEAKARLGRIDILHNNVGVGGRDNSLTQLEGEVFDRIMTTNLKAMWLTIKHFLPVMREQGGGGAIVNISSMAAVAASNLIAYGMSKAGVNKLTRATAAGNTRYMIRCNCIMPGLMDTHTHILLQGDITAADYDEQLLKQSPEYRTILATVNARRMLSWGFTSIRDLETEGAGYADVDVKNAIERGVAVPAPGQAAAAPDPRLARWSNPFSARSLSSRRHSLPCLRLLPVRLRKALKFSARQLPHSPRTYSLQLGEGI